ncbi:hypothetical protein [Olsenella uli]
MLKVILTSPNEPSASIAAFLNVKVADPGMDVFLLAGKLPEMYRDLVADE